mmetsp:Transcript_20923/g.31145  ORF Transcript_20923/g.31145 Transcript_20923/m.31145 type:complete len:210 (-) Transcript_20923:1012-1641(-)
MMRKKRVWWHTRQRKSFPFLFHQYVFLLILTKRQYCCQSMVCSYHFTFPRSKMFQKRQTMQNFESILSHQVLVLVYMRHARTKILCSEIIQTRYFYEKQLFVVRAQHIPIKLIVRFRSCASGYASVSNFEKTHKDFKNKVNLSCPKEVEYRAFHVLKCDQLLAVVKLWAILRRTKMDFVLWQKHHMLTFFTKISVMLSFNPPAQHHLWF